jgi:hypothetical protein
MRVTNLHGTVEVQHPQDEAWLELEREFWRKMQSGASETSIVRGYQTKVGLTDLLIFASRRLRAETQKA